MFHSGLMRSGARMGTFRRSLLRWPVVLAAVIAPLLAVPVQAGVFQASALRDAVDAVAIGQLSHCRPWPHWHPWEWGRGCGEIQMPRDRRGWRFRDWRRLR
jgi:hypothetical protein